MDGLDPACPQARLLREAHERRSRVAEGLDGSRLAGVVRDRRAREEAAHLAACPACQAWTRVCSRCRRAAGRHSFFCRENPARWRSLFARKRARPKRAPRPSAWHEVLGVPPGASMDEIRRAYRALALECHPDRLAGASARRRRQAEARMRAINEAYAALRLASH